MEFRGVIAVRSPIRKKRTNKICMQRIVITASKG